MLNFLENRSDNASASITGIARKASIQLGVSYETPEQFTNETTVMGEKTYINPHYKYENLRLSKMSLPQKLRAIENSWTRKNNINLIEEHKVLGRDHTISRYHDNHCEALKQNGCKFRSVKGEFTGFIHDQHHNQSLAPIEGFERTLDRARQTKNRIWRQSIDSLQRTKQYLYSQPSDPHAQSAMRKSSMLRAQQIGSIRKNRQLLYHSIQSEQQTRRYRYSHMFQLPKVLKQQVLQKQQSKFYKDGFYTIDCRSLKRIGLGNIDDTVDPTP